MYEALENSNETDYKRRDEERQQVAYLIAHRVELFVVGDVTWEDKKCVQYPILDILWYNVKSDDKVDEQIKFSRA